MQVGRECGNYRHADVQFSARRPTRHTESTMPLSATHAAWIPRTRQVSASIG
jgi:hypothetical protein